MNGIVAKATAIWKFTRPHAFLGTAASIVCLWLLATATHPIALEAWIGLLSTLVICLSAALLIVGINQYFDVAIDRINKPQLPLASLELSQSQAKAILILSAAIAFIGVLFTDVFLQATVFLSAAIGLAYSCPPFRLKHSPYLAALAIIFVRGPVINLGLYGHFHILSQPESDWNSASVFGSVSEFPPVIWLLCGLCTLLAICIAICKDIPDVEGDAGHGQQTFARSVGQAKVFRVVIVGLTLTLSLSALSFAFIFRGLVSVVMILLQLIVVSFLVWRSTAVDPTRRDSITPFYMWIWNIFQMEYVAITVAYLLTHIPHPKINVECGFGI